jgi:hypothetical protein
VAYFKALYRQPLYMIGTWSGRGLFQGTLSTAALYDWDMDQSWLISRHFSVGRFNQLRLGVFVT